MTVAPLLDQPGWQVMTLHDISSAEAISGNPTDGDDSVLRAPELALAGSAGSVAQAKAAMDTRFFILGSWQIL